MLGNTYCAMGNPQCPRACRISGAFWGTSCVGHEAEAEVKKFDTVVSGAEAQRKQLSAVTASV